MPSSSNVAPWSERAWAHLLTAAPLRAYTRMLRAAGRVPLPSGLREPVWGRIAAAMGIDVNEAEQRLAAYRCFSDLFVRRLRAGARAIADAGTAVVSPVDGVLTMAGEVQRGMLVQAKGVDYSLEGLSGDPTLARQFEGGSYLTIYLRPKDYHRIHSPVTGFMRGHRFIRGRLLPVKPFMIRNVPGLLAQNERLAILLESEVARVLVVCVAAAGVGTVTLARRGGNGTPAGGGELALEKGDELAVFNLGSTVVMLIEPNRVEVLPLSVGQEIRMGQAVARALTR